MKYYKSLTEDHEGPYSGFNFTKYLPKGNKPGKWLPAIKSLDMCESGYHCSTATDIIDWLKYEVYEVELRGKTIKGDNKTCSEQIRITKQVMNNYDLRLFACDCADRVLELFEKKYPDDKRPRRAIETARRKDSTQQERAAAWAAAGAAAGAAGAAAGDAWAAAGAAWAAAGDAGAAAWAAAGAAWAAAGDAGAAAWAAEKKWQIKRLMWYLKKQR